LLEGKSFTIYCDHKPLTFAYKQRNEKACPRQLRHLQFISQFSTDIRHIKGADNIIADTLSRIEELESIDYDKIADSQATDDELHRLRQGNTSLNLRAHTLPSGKTLWCDISTQNIRPYIPQRYRSSIFHQIHGLAHPGVKATVKQVTSKFVWPSIRQDIRKWAQACHGCQKSKVTRHTKTEHGAFQEPDERFTVIHIDLIGPLPPSDGKIYCLTCIDRFTSWMEVIPIGSITAETVAKNFYNHWITRFGVPIQVITDQGRQFESELFRSLAKLCGAKITHTTPYHPQCNGKIERLHRTLKAAMKAHQSLKWTDTIPTILMGLRAALKDDGSYSIAQMVYGKTIRLPGEFFEESKTIEPESFTSNLQKQMRALRPVKMEKHSRQSIFVHADLKTCTHVFVRTDRVKKPLDPAYTGPYKIIKRTPKWFILDMKGRNSTISLDRLKPAYLLAEHQELTSSPEPTSYPQPYDVTTSSSKGNSQRKVLFNFKNNKERS